MHSGPVCAGVWQEEIHSPACSIIRSHPFALWYVRRKKKRVRRVASKFRLFACISAYTTCPCISQQFHVGVCVNVYTCACACYMRLILCACIIFFIYRFIDGARAGHGLMHKRLQYPRGTIAPFRFLWRPLPAALTQAAATAHAPSALVMIFTKSLDEIVHARLCVCHFCAIMS